MRDYSMPPWPQRFEDLAQQGLSAARAALDRNAYRKFTVQRPLDSFYSTHKRTARECMTRKAKLAEKPSFRRVGNSHN
jgi:hypothetical protein